MKPEIIKRFNGWVAQVKRYHPSDTILLCGSPRSGTTWLGGLLSASNGYCMLTEPFHPDYFRAHDVDLTYRQFKRPEDEWKEGYGVITRIFKGQALPYGVYQDNSFGQMLFSKALILKCVRANRLLPWILNRIQPRHVVFLIRHPCAVVSSQMQHPAFRGSDAIVFDEDRRLVTTDFPFLSTIADNCKSEEERRAFSWCLDQYIPLSYPGIRSCTLVPYEKLIVNGESELEKIYSGLGWKVSKKSREQLKRSSRETHQWSVKHEQASVTERLGTWKQHLTGAQAERILSVVKACGIQGYSQAVEPQYEAIFKMDFMNQ